DRLADAGPDVLDLVSHRIRTRALLARRITERVIPAADRITMLSATVPAVEDREQIPHVARQHPHAEQCHADDEAEDGPANVSHVRNRFTPAEHRAGELLEYIQQKEKQHEPQPRQFERA